MLETQRISKLPETRELRHRAALDEYARGEYQKALHMARALIDEDFGHANALAGVIYETGGHGVEQDFSKARFYYERATQTVGSLEAWLGLARMHYFGKGTSKDPNRAAEYYSIAEKDADNGVAQLMLGRIYSDTESPLYDPTKAREYFGRAASKGYVFANSFWSDLEWKLGNHVRAIWLRVKAAALALLISRTDAFDSRLRRC